MTYEAVHEIRVQYLLVYFHTVFVMKSKMLESLEIQVENNSLFWRIPLVNCMGRF